MSNEGRSTQRKLIDPVTVGFLIERTERGLLNELAKAENMTLSSFIAKTIRDALNMEETNDSAPIRYF